MCEAHLEQVIAGFERVPAEFALVDVPFDASRPSIGPVQLEPWPGAGLQEVLPETTVTAGVYGVPLAPVRPPTFEGNRLHIEYDGLP